MRMDALLIGIALLSLVMSVAIGVVEDASRQTGVAVDTTFFGEYDVNGTVLSDLSIQQKDKIFGESDSTLGFLDSMVKKAKGVFDLFTKPIEMINAMLVNLTDNFGLPPIFGVVVTTILTIAVIFAVAYLYFRIRSW